MTVLARPFGPSAFAVFRNRGFALLWVGQSTSTVGSALTSLATSILVYRLTSSVFSIGLMLMATALPSLLIGLVAGVYVDRWDRRRIMVLADLLRAALVALVPVLVPHGITWLYVIVLLNSAFTQFFAPAYESVLPEVASTAELTAAHTLLAISSFGFTTVGFAAAGLVAARFPLAWAFWLDALSFLLSAACIAGIRLSGAASDAPASTVASVVENLRSGMQWLLRTPSLRSLLLVLLPVGFVYGLQNALLLPFALDALGANELQYALLEGLASVGFVGGSLLMSRLAERLHEGQWIVASYFGVALTSLALALLRSVPPAMVIAFLSGVLGAPAVIGRRLIVQRSTPRDGRGRVSGVLFVANNLVFAAGMMAAGVADLIDARQLLAASGTIVLVSAWLAVLLPGVRQPTAEWRHALRLLRSAPIAPGLGLGRAAMLSDWEQLALRMPAFAALGPQQRQHLIRSARVYEAPPGTAIVRHGDRSDAAYVVLEGRAIAGREEADAYRALEVLQRGDFFGEIAALTGALRTANVIAEQPTTLVQIPAATLRRLAEEPTLHALLIAKLSERMVRMSIVELPRFAGVDQAALRELRAPELQPIQ